MTGSKPDSTASGVKKLCEKLQAGKPVPGKQAEALIDTLLDNKNCLKTVAQDPGVDFLVLLGKGLLGATGASPAAADEVIHKFLNIARAPCVLQVVQKRNQQNAWFELLLELVRASNFTLAQLFIQRMEQYSTTPFLKIMDGQRVIAYSWRRVRERVLANIKGLLQLRQELGVAPRVALFSSNSLELICFDLACLISGVVNIPLPTNATTGSIDFIIKDSGANTIFVTGRRRLQLVLKLSDSIPKIRKIIATEQTEKAAPESLVSLKAFIKKAAGVKNSDVDSALQRVALDDLATIMYTSGTTETPKGIRFSQQSLVSKRFARAIALPEVGDKDTFICYLPLFHTFGRLFEMMGCLFWGATYVLADSTRIDLLSQAMKLTRPTVFISIPKKWIQIHQRIAELVDIEHAPAEKIESAISRVTGGALKWGLSAAGYLDPDIFTFFQRHDIEIMSGFGMTEAAGGITMTPPREYRSNSVGIGLPGIEIALADDGEMLVRGPYVMTGYVDPENTGIENGWFHTGDIFTADADGYYEIVDRKKEIYKNLRGETIAPQKIENMFNDFESIKRVFLVGDHREYNTLMIFPSYDYDQVELSKLSEDELKEFFSSFIVSVNQFLSPFERILDFSIIDRDFNAEAGELTPKGTFKRKIVEANFQATIEEMYRAGYLSLKSDKFELRVPNWFLREKGWTSQDLKIGRADKLRSPGAKLDFQPVRQRDTWKVRLGDYSYVTTEQHLDLGHILADPSLWLGNLNLIEFSRELSFKKQAPGAPGQGRVRVDETSLRCRATASVAAQLDQVIATRDLSQYGVHLAAHVLLGGNESLALRGVDYLEIVILNKEEKIVEFAKLALMRAAAGKKKTLRKRAFQVLVLTENRDLLTPVLQRFLPGRPTVLDDETVACISDHDLSREQLASMVSYLNSETDLFWAASTQKKTMTVPVAKLLHLLTEYGLRHPLSYKVLRTHLLRWAVFAKDPKIVKAAKGCAIRLQNSFRNWLGKNVQIAIDPNSHTEVRWRDVLAFDEQIADEHKQRIAAAVQNCPLLREAIFLFSEGRIIPLHEIPRNGIWVSFLGTLHGKSVYRVSVQTHTHGAFEVAVNVNRSLSKREVQDEMNWLIATGALQHQEPLVEDFGGYWPEYDLWTEEFIHGNTVGKHLQRLERRTDKSSVEQAKNLWPSFAWSGLTAYVDFWDRTGRLLQIADPTPANVIVPEHDYQVGFRIVSISERKRFTNALDMIVQFRKDFIEEIEGKHHNLKGQCGWRVVFSAFLEVLGEAEGIQFLQDALDSRAGAGIRIPRELKKRLREFIEDVSTRGYVPRRLQFAIDRFNRWHSLNPTATSQACTHTMRDLYTTYDLNSTAQKYPGTRIQFFRDTVFKEADTRIRGGLDKCIRRAKMGELRSDDLVDECASLRHRHKLSPHEEVYLTRLSYPYLGASDSAEFISLQSEGEAKMSLMVFIESREGDNFAIRNPANPKEIARLHKLFTAANLPVEFKPEHQFLVVLDARVQVVGGLFYRPVAPGHIHLEKVVVDPYFRKKGVSQGLLTEFFNRAKGQEIKIITVGFFRPQYFYKFGFRIDQRYGNMVRKLRVDEAETPSLPVGDFAV